MWWVGHVCRQDNASGGLEVKEPYAVFSLASLRAFAVLTVALMLMTAVAPALNKAIEDGKWPPLPSVGDEGSSDQWSSSTPPEGAPVVPGHEYDAAMAIGKLPTTWVLDSNMSKNVTVEIFVVNTYGGPVEGMMLEQFLTSNVTLLDASVTTSCGPSAAWTSTTPSA